MHDLGDHSYKKIEIPEPFDVMPEDPPLKIHEVGPGIFQAQSSLSAAGWVVTSEGVVVVDTLIRPGLAKMMLQEIRKITTAPIRFIIYTHGHLDHLRGASVLLDDRPEILAHENLPVRLKKYEMLWDHYLRINSIQFHRKLDGPPEFVYPTKTYHPQYTFRMGGLTFNLIHFKGETDDHTIVWIPERRTVFVGDLIIGSMPNLGNPFKPNRAAKEWFEALEMIKTFDPEIVISGGLMRNDLEDKGFKKAINDNIAFLRFVHDETIRHINAGSSLDEMLASIRLPLHLEKSPYIQPTYSRLEFAIINVYRFYCGFFDFNPAHLLRTPEKERMAEIFDLVGDTGIILERVRKLQSDGRLQLALEILDIILQNDSKHRKGRELRAGILKDLVDHDTCLMSRNTFIHYLEEDLRFLRKQ